MATPWVILPLSHVGTVRNDFTGCIGVRFLVGAAPITVTDLGRYQSNGADAGNHNLKLVVRATGLDVPGGAVVVNMAGTPINTYKYGALGAPVILAAATQYYLVSAETNAGDHWLDNDSTYTADPVASTQGACFSAACVAGTYSENGGSDHGYGIPDFKFQGAIPPVGGGLVMRPRWFDDWN